MRDLKHCLVNAYILYRRAGGDMDALVFMRAITLHLFSKQAGYKVLVETAEQAFDTMASEKTLSTTSGATQ